MSADPAPAFQIGRIAPIWEWHGQQGEILGGKLDRRGVGGGPCKGAGLQSLGAELPAQDRRRTSVSGTTLWESTVMGKRRRHPEGLMISTDGSWGETTSGGRSWTGMMRGLASGVDACKDEIRIQRRTDMGWTPMRAAKSLAEWPDCWNGWTRSWTSDRALWRREVASIHWTENPRQPQWWESGIPPGCSDSSGGRRPVVSLGSTTGSPLRCLRRPPACVNPGKALHPHVIPSGWQRGAGG